MPTTLFRLGLLLFASGVSGSVTFGGRSAVASDQAHLVSSATVTETRLGDALLSGLEGRGTIADPPRVPQGEVLPEAATERPASAVVQAQPDPYQPEEFNGSVLLR